MGEVYSFIKKYLENGIYPLHMPGHKGNRAFLPPELLDMEITEIPGADNLLEPEGIIAALEARFAERAGAGKSFLGTNGSTGGILGALSAVCAEGRPVIVARNCHRSVYSALILTGAMPVYVFPQITDIGIIGGIEPVCVAETIGKYPNAAAVVITSPTYEGIVSDVACTQRLIQPYGIPLIVDSAHGAHFAFSPAFPRSAVACGADIAVESLHKQLPMFSQMAVTHVAGGLISPELVKRSLSLFQTTSPSYMLLAQADYALSMLLGRPWIMADYVARLLEFRLNFSSPFMKLMGGEYIGRYGIYDIDPAKLVLYGDFNGSGAERALARDFGVQAEMSGARHVVALTTCADGEEGFRRLGVAVKGFSPPDSPLSPRAEAARAVMVEPVVAMPPKEAFYGEAEAVSLKNARGRVSAGFITPYPPGIPLAAPGELITDRVIETVEYLVKIGINVIGAEGVQVKGKK